MKVLIVEDEKLASERLKELLKEIDPSIEVSAEITSVDETVNWLRENKTDLIFLDIQLSDGLSFNIFEKMKIDIPVIFTTAYDQYAIKAFKVNSVDYLLKPIKKRELVESLNKFKNLKSSFIHDFEELLRNYTGKAPEYKKRFLIQYGTKIKKVETEEIAAFYSMEKNVFMVTFQKSNYPVNFTLDKLEEVLDPEKFFRINRKMIINFDSITNMVPYSRSRIKVDLAVQLPKEIEALVSVERAKSFKDWLDK